MPLVVVWTLVALVGCGGRSGGHVSSSRRTVRNGKIAFASDRDGDAEIYVMNPDGSGVTRLTTSPGLDTEPAWSPDGKKIAFASNRDSDDLEIYVMNADGSGVTRLTHHPNWQDTAPTWSPDGSGILFAGRNIDLGFETGFAWDLFVMNAGGSGFQPIHITPRDRLYYSVPDMSDEVYPDWSPDGRSIAFTYGCVDECGISFNAVMNADGSGIRTLVEIDPDQWSDYGPTWSPDGKSFVFHRGGVGDLEGAIFVINADGSGLQELQGTTEEDDAPAWSPDGTKIVLARSFDYDCPPSSTVPNCPAYDIFIMNPDGSEQVRLTNSSTSDGVPDWQPVIG